MVDRYVRVDLSGADISMAKQSLHRPEIRAALNHVGCATVAKLVWAGLSS